MLDFFIFPTKTAYWLKLKDSLMLKKLCNWKMGYSVQFNCLIMYQVKKLLRQAFYSVRLMIVWWWCCMLLCTFTDNVIFNIVSRTISPDVIESQRQSGYSNRKVFIHFFSYVRAKNRRLSFFFSNICFSVTNLRFSNSHASVKLLKFLKENIYFDCEIK